MGAGYPDADTAEQASAARPWDRSGFVLPTRLLHHFTDGNGGNLSDGIADMRTPWQPSQVAQGKSLEGVSKMVL